MQSSFAGLASFSILDVNLEKGGKNCFKFISSVDKVFDYSLYSLLNNKTILGNTS